MGNHGTVTAVVIPNLDKYYYSEKFKKTLVDFDNKVNDVWHDSVYAAQYNRDIAYALTCRGCEGYQRGSQVNVIVDGEKDNVSVSELHEKYDTEEKIRSLKIRKLTSKECFRLMGFSDLDWERASEVITESWIYHTAGDSIVVNVIEELIKQIV